MEQSRKRSAGAVSTSPSGMEQRMTNSPIKHMKREHDEHSKHSPGTGSHSDEMGDTPEHEQDVDEKCGQKEGKTGKRKKVNHACVYCRRSHMTCDHGRPCSRCIKRNIGHLCHDEPRETKRRKKEGPERLGSKHEEAEDKEESTDGLELGNVASQQSLENESPELVQVASANLNSGQTFDVLSQPLYSDWTTPGFQSQLNDIHTYNPNYLFNTSEVTNEYNMLNEFLNTSLLDEGAFYPGGDASTMFTDHSIGNIMGPVPNTAASPITNSLSHQIAPPVQLSRTTSSRSTTRPSRNTTSSTYAPANTSTTIKDPIEKAQEKYYLTAADPAGSSSADSRITTLLAAKQAAGLLKPFNYVKGYARLNTYMEKHTTSPTTRQRVLRQIERFRPRFRERMQRLTDAELTRVEMWFERKLMEYDRVFASMSVPACCWRRTGEIFRGNREMATLVDIDLGTLRGGKLAIHEIFTEESLVSYWEKFGAIAFETSQKAMLTTCSLKRPNSKPGDKEVKCCFSFTIQRDSHAIPSLIIGNFLPILPHKSQA